MLDVSCDLVVNTPAAEASLFNVKEEKITGEKVMNSLKRWRSWNSHDILGVNTTVATLPDKKGMIISSSGGLAY